MKQRLARAISEALKTLYEPEPDRLPEFKVEQPREARHGDLASNVALVSARLLRQPPRKIAESLQQRLAAEPWIAKVEVAGPGFLNFFIAEQFWQQVCLEVLRQGPDYGRSQPASRENVLVEFVSANPTGPLHFGHGRGAVVGDVLANLLEFAGHRVTREYYVNDAGAQVQALVDTLIYHLRLERGLEAEFPEDGYRGDYVAELAEQLPAELTFFLPGPADATARAELRRFALERMMANIRSDLEAFGVQMDNFASEAEIVAARRVDQVLERLQKRKYAEMREGALFFLADKFGDEKPRVLVKSNGQHTYFATDVAYHLDKVERGFSQLINVWGADHHGYVPRMHAALEALGVDPQRLQVVLVQMVSLLRNGQPVVLSKRQGQIITLRQVIDEVGADAARFFFLLRGPDSQMEFDLELAKRRSLDNPVFYVQYGHARLCSLLARARERGIVVPESEQLTAADLEPLRLPEELDLLKRMAELPETIVRAGASRAPHQLVYYLQQLVAAFHRYYTTYGKTSPILSNDRKLTTARLGLVLAMRQVVANCLQLLGVSAPQRMETPEEET